jgi:hypothetical protein
MRRLKNVSRKFHLVNPDKHFQLDCDYYLIVDPWIERGPPIHFRILSNCCDCMQSIRSAFGQLSDRCNMTQRF